MAMLRKEREHRSAGTTCPEFAELYEQVDAELRSSGKIAFAPPPRLRLVTADNAAQFKPTRKKRKPRAVATGGNVVSFAQRTIRER